MRPQHRWLIVIATTSSPCLLRGGFIAAVGLTAAASFVAGHFLFRCSVFVHVVAVSSVLGL